MNIVRDVVVCMACGALILGVPYAVFLLGRILGELQQFHGTWRRR